MNDRTRVAWTFLIPMLLLMALVAGWPLARSVWFSLTETNINDISSSRFVGLSNYFGEYGLFFNPNHTEGFWASDWGISIANTFQFAIASVVLETLAGLGVAMLLNQEFRGRTLVRTAVLVPWAIPTIVSVKIWGWMLHDQFGLIFVLTSNSGSTISMSGFVRREMVDNGNLGFGSAASTSLTLIIFLSAILFMRAARVRLSEEAS